MGTDPHDHPIGRDIRVLSGFAFPSASFSETEGLPLVRIRDLGQTTTEVRFRGAFQPRFLLQNGDVLVGMDGDFNAIRWNGGVALINQRVCCVSAAIGGTLDGGFLFHLLQPELDRIHRRTPQTTVRHLSTKDLYAIQTYVPPPAEQRRIAVILDTIDEAIRRTEQVIAKLQQMKQGLLHDLLTRGVDENGNLRPPPEEAPELYKDSPLGRIPKGWSTLPLGMAAEISYGISDAIEQTRVDGIPTITLPCVSPDGGLNLSPELLAWTNPTKAFASMCLQPGDLLFNWRNGSRHHLGKTAFFESDATYTHVGFLLRIRSDKSICYPYFLWQVIREMKTAGFFLRAKSQVNNTFNSAELRSVEVIFPPLCEQERVAQMLRNVEGAIGKESAGIDKLHDIKIGLFNDLLTGQVRIAVTDGATK